MTLLHGVLFLVLQRAVVGQPTRLQVAGQPGRPASGLPNHSIRCDHGGAVQVDTIKTRVESAQDVSA
jgi:hypothetical protein